ncbi:MAG: hypothetical protein LLF76_03320 [Planctomycetaceae bacterium]|nr:hypothetical protein [Planctomycetaceae bacterium]
MKIQILCAMSVAALLVSGCTSQLEQAVDYYHQEAPRVQIGMDKEQVLSILEPTQETLPAGERRPPESYTDSNGQLIEIYFFRSNYYYYGGILTDDQFTPYVFTNGKLTAIGWSTLGGPRTEIVPVPYPYSYYPYYPYYGPSHFNFGFGYSHHHH